MEKIRQNYVKIGVPQSPEMVSGSIKFLEEAGFSPIAEPNIYFRQLWLLSGRTNSGIIIAELNFMPDDQIPGLIATGELEIGISKAAFIKTLTLDTRSRLRVITGLPPLYFGTSGLLDGPAAIGRRRSQSSDNNDPVEILSLKLIAAASNYERNRPCWAEKYDR